MLPAALAVLGWSSGLREVWVLHFPGLPKLRRPEYRPWPGYVEITKLTADFCHKLLLQMHGKGDRHAQVRVVCTGQRSLAIWSPGVLSTEESMFVGTKYFPPVFKSRGMSLLPTNMEKRKKKYYFPYLFFRLNGLWYIPRVTFAMLPLPKKIGCPYLLSIKRAK